MAKYITQYYKKTSSISKDKELMEILDLLNNDKISKEKAFYLILKNNIERKNNLYKYSKNVLIKSFFSENDMKDKKDDIKKFISFIKDLEKDFFSDKIFSGELVNKVFDYAKENTLYISRKNFLMYIKKIQQEKLLSDLKNNPVDVFKKLSNGTNLFNFFFNFEKKIITLFPFNDVENIKKEFFSNIVIYLKKKKINSVIADDVSSVFHSSAFEKAMKKKHLVKVTRKLLFKIINSEPISNKELISLFNINIKSFNFKNEKKDKIEKYVGRILRKFIFNNFLSFYKEKIKNFDEENIINDLNKYTAVMPYYEELKKIKNMNIDIDNLSKESLKTIIFSSFDEKNYLSYFNYNEKSNSKLLKIIDNLMEYSNEEVLKEKLNLLKVKIKKLKNENITSENFMEIKELYEDIKESVFIYEKNNNELILSFSVFRDYFKETFLHTNNELKQLYCNFNLDKLEIELENGTILKFNENSRVFECFNENKEIIFSLPVSAVMSKDRRKVNEKIDLKYILSSDKYIFNNMIIKKNLRVKNLEDVNRQLQENIKRDMEIKNNFDNINKIKEKKDNHGFTILK